MGFFYIKSHHVHIYYSLLNYVVNGWCINALFDVFCIIIDRKAWR